MPILKLRTEELDDGAIRLFKDKAVKRGRLTEEETLVSDKLLLENLHLVDDDGYLTRAAMLAFYRDPERWVTGAYIKIGFFGDSDSDLRYQDEIHGPLIGQVDKAMDLLYTKYMKALIGYRGIQRIEQFMFSRSAMREILLNAVVHKDYAECNPIQISVYEDKIYVWNDGQMPAELMNPEKLFEKHSSKPYNPKLANVFFKSGMIEAWGRGFDKIRAGCEEYGGPLPEYNITENGIMVFCKPCDYYMELLNQTSFGRQDQNKPAIDEENLAIVHENLAIQRILLAIDGSDCSESTKFRMKAITTEFDRDDIFGTKEVSALFHCSASTARNTISKMRDLEIIVPVTGQGKGKYKWNLAFQTGNVLSPK